MLIYLSLLKQCTLIWAEVTSQGDDPCILLWFNWCFNKHYHSHAQGLLHLSVLWGWGRNKVLYLWCLNTFLSCGFHCLLQCWTSLWERRTHTRLHESGLLLCAGVKGALQMKETDPIWKQTSSVLKERSSSWIIGGWTTIIGQQRGSDIANGLSGFAWFCYSATSCRVWVERFVCVALAPFLHEKKHKGRLTAKCSDCLCRENWTDILKTHTLPVPIPRKVRGFQVEYKQNASWLQRQYRRGDLNCTARMSPCLSSLCHLGFLKWHTVKPVCAVNPAECVL